MSHPRPSTRPTVLHVLWSLDIGGAERAVYQLVREQLRSGMRADVLVASHAGFYGELARKEGAVLHELGQQRALDVRRALKAASIIRCYEIAHFHGREPLLMEIACRQGTARLVYTHRGGVKPYSRRKRIRHRLVRRSLRGFDVLSANTVQSARAASKIFRIPQKEFHVVYNGVDFSLLAPARVAEDVRAEAGLPPDGVVVGTCAKLLGLKRIDRLFELRPRFRRTCIALSSEMGLSAIRSNGSPTTSAFADE